MERHGPPWHLAAISVYTDSVPRRTVALRKRTLGDDGECRWVQMVVAPSGLSLSPLEPSGNPPEFQIATDMIALS